jgi:hypothetical protein
MRRLDIDEARRGDSLRVAGEDPHREGGAAATGAAEKLAVERGK